MEPIKIPFTSLTRALQGVVTATGASDTIHREASQWVSKAYWNEGRNPNYSLVDLRNALNGITIFDPKLLLRTNSLTGLLPPHHKVVKLVIGVAVAVASLLETARQGKPSREYDLDDCWYLIWDALRTNTDSPSDVDADLGPKFSVSRDAQGFFSVPIYRTLTAAGDIGQLLSLHVWEPDFVRGNTDFTIRSHQTYMQSWVLAGEVRTHIYEVVPVSALDVAAGVCEGSIFESYEPTRTGRGGSHDAENDEKDCGSTYETLDISHLGPSTFTRTGRTFRATLKPPFSSTHDRVALFNSGKSFAISAGSFHRLEVAPDALHAVLCLFDSRRGLINEPGMLGPVRGLTLTQSVQDLGPVVTLSRLLKDVGIVRGWERSIRTVDRHFFRSEWEYALRAAAAALPLVEPSDRFARYRSITLGRLGFINRRLGRYRTARDLLERITTELPPSELRVPYVGELGVLYRQVGRLVDAERSFQEYHDTSKQFGLPRETCRAVAHLGMLYYKMAQSMTAEGGDAVEQRDVLLNKAISTLTQSVELTRRFRQTTRRDPQSMPAPPLDPVLGGSECMSLSHLSLCHQAQGNSELAINASLESLQLAVRLLDPSVAALSRFFYGRALLLAGRRKEALSQFNIRNESPPAAALAREHSDEHRAYIAELVEAGADMDNTDRQGYTALDYAVFNGDSAMQTIILEGMRRNAEARIARRLEEAHLRKGYREILQEHMRPVLDSHWGDDEGLAERRRPILLRSLRASYAHALAADQQKKATFDPLKYIPWEIFKAFGRLPRSSDGLARDYSVEEHHVREVPLGEEGPGFPTRETRTALPPPPLFIIFFSYRWINKEPGATSPDDANRTQYLRMIDAVTGFLQDQRYRRQAQPVEPSKVGIWMDFACVDQDDPAKGVAALPMIVAQCDAVISIVDDQYYDRAWCCVEALMAQTLRDRFGLHLWYEYDDKNADDDDDDDEEGGVKVEGNDGYRDRHASESKGKGKEQEEEEGIMGKEEGGREKLEQRQASLGKEDVQGWLCEAPHRSIEMKDKLLSYEEDRHNVMFLERQSKLLGYL